LAPFCFPNPPKSFKNPTPRGIKNLIAFGFDFWSMLDPFWEPSWSHVGHLFRPKTAQEASKTAQDAQPERENSPRRLKTLPRHPKPRPDDDFGTILKRCWKMFGRFMRKIAVQPAFSNLLSKKACLHKFAFQKSQPKLNTGSLPVFSSRSTLSKKASLKTKGPAVIAAGVGN